MLISWHSLVLVHIFGTKLVPDKKRVVLPTVVLRRHSFDDLRSENIYLVYVPCAVKRINLERATSSSCLLRNCPWGYVSILSSIGGLEQMPYMTAPSCLYNVLHLSACITCMLVV